MAQQPKRRRGPVAFAGLLALAFLLAAFYLWSAYPRYLRQGDLVQALFNLFIGGATVSFAYAVISTVGAKKEIGSAVVSLFSGDANVMRWLSPAARRGAVTAAFTASFGGDRGGIVFDHVVGKYFQSPVNFAYVFDYEVILTEAPPPGIDSERLQGVLGLSEPYRPCSHFWVTTEFTCGIQIFDPTDPAEDPVELGEYELSIVICFDGETFEALSKRITTADRRFIIMRELMLDHAANSIRLDTLRDATNLRQVVAEDFGVRVWALNSETLQEEESANWSAIPRELNGRPYLSIPFSVADRGKRSAAYRIRTSFPQRRDQRHFVCSMPWPTKNPSIRFVGLPGTLPTCIPLTSSLDPSTYEIVASTTPDGRPRILYRGTEWHFPRSAVLVNW